ncbi:hypothetical protein CLAFUW4_11299 [Fulvia fulva]|uniref:Uncharacterized protein n=1 Tax=Passalora fulva TaxID=5499 RepID=A0A9Q8PC28_PASFU|nr:uncharacterized protein CLAFUR5_10339 [Fulvia fulva]KAK4619704.1 hypothetical protein CLAFUR4_11305 [Fulvia fulva]KAK4620570.1 hypothetical protein CLAFUR0_11310 [Fulvia fulva]UJO19652.1 hypothetical protein CLAFUR5_10339 [Fulvia fulva]WPV16994.1 hypothetical protein CLAFUW4_11299 [Fulvia fulva]WPV32234.1 hypothetical protein CLAFUW7_11295 [Fulvia fulva]
MAPPVIWGLDLAEMQWYKFGSKYMFKNRDYHLRRTKFIVYQCALIFCVVSESLGTAALSDMLDAQDFVKGLDHNVYVYNNDYIGVASFNIFAGVFVAFIFGAAFFFDLFWPARRESRAVMLAWQICGVLAVAFMTGTAFALTVITAMRCQYFRSADGIPFTAAYGQSLLSQFKKDGGTPLCYRDNGRAVAAVVFVWLGFLSVVGSCILLFMSISHYKKLGPYSTHARPTVEEKDPEAGHLSEAEIHEPQHPAAVHQAPAVNDQVDGAAT